MTNPNRSYGQEIAAQEMIEAPGPADMTNRLEQILNGQTGSLQGIQKVILDRKATRAQQANSQPQIKAAERAVLENE